MSASEPSEILWENRHVTESKRRCNKMIVFMLSALFLLGMFFLFTFMKSIEVANMFRYPATMNCESIQSIFANQLDIYNEYAEIDKPYT